MEKCELCKNKESEHIHHKDLNHKNNDKINLQKVCTLCHAKLHNIEPKRSELKDKVILLNRNQKTRIVIENQIRGFGRIEMNIPSYYLEIKDRLINEEKKITREIELLLKGKRNILIKNHPKCSSFLIYPYLKSIKGLGTLHCAYLIAYIDIDKTPSVSCLWSYCGQTPNSKKTKGKKSNWNPVLKQRCFNIAESFIKSKSSYKKIYDKEKQIKMLDKSINNLSKQFLNDLSNNDILEGNQTKVEKLNQTCSPPKSKMHAHRRAMRKMVKEFLKDLWVKWNRLNEQEKENGRQ